MSLTVYVTEDFGTMPEKNRFQRRRVVEYPNIRRRTRDEVGLLELERAAYHAINLPEVTPNPFQRVWNTIQYKWYSFRVQLAQKIRPKQAPKTALREAAKLRHANLLERRRILEDLWQELSAEREPQVTKVLRIEEPTEFLVEDE